VAERAKAEKVFCERSMVVLTCARLDSLAPALFLLDLRDERLGGSVISRAVWRCRAERSRSHGAAGLCAGPTCHHTFVHFSDPLAIVGAFAANLRAFSARMPVMR
jgi:hypothetical protein